MRSPFIPIKICGLTRETDVDAAVELGVQALGFVLYPASPRAVSAERAADLARRLPAFVAPVLLFVNATSDEVARAAEQVPGAWLQFHGEETPDFCLQTARRLGRRFIRAARIPQGDVTSFDLVKYAQDYSHADALLLDTLVPGYGGSGHAFQWSQLPQSVNSHLVLSGGLTPANVGDGLHALRGRGKSLSVDVSSGVETTKGVKDPLKMQAFIQAVRQA
ncbi:MAG: phosphoribosylanthranilate isomerase [Alphaproteobacteria bacterium]|nr:phosphoribosylanthranilate isomerase [Alphaproteobacteria bacterium]